MANLWTMDRKSTSQASAAATSMTTLMSQSAQNKLLRQRTISAFKEIVSAVNPGDVLDQLFTSRVLSAHKVELIRSRATKTEQCRQLLLYLTASRHPRAFIVFRQSLSSNYPWLVDRIDSEQDADDAAAEGYDEIDGVPSVTDMNKSLRNKFLVMEPTLADNVAVTEILDHLLAAQVIDFKSVIKVTSEPSNGQKCWRRLLKAVKRRKHARGFVELREALKEDYQYLVDELDSIAFTDENSDDILHSESSFIDNFWRVATKKKKKKSRKTAVTRSDSKKLSAKHDISQPTNAEHRCNIRWNSEIGRLDLDLPDSSVKVKVELMFKAMGLDAAQVANKETADFMSVFISQQGGLHSLPTLPRQRPQHQHHHQEQQQEQEQQQQQQQQQQQSHEAVPLVQISIADSLIHRQRSRSRSPAQDLRHPREEKDGQQRQQAVNHRLAKRHNRVTTEIYLVQGVAQLFDKVYVICAGSSTILVYDTVDGCQQVDDIEVTGLTCAWDLVACPINRCLYVTDFSNDCVWRIDLEVPTSPGGRRSGTRIHQWSEGVGEPWTISVTDRGELVQLATAEDDQVELSRNGIARYSTQHSQQCEEPYDQSPKSLIIHGADGQQASRIRLTTEVSEPHHAVMTGSGTWYISHGLSGPLHRVCEVSGDGQRLLRCYGSSPGSNPGQLHRPWYLAVETRTDRVFVVDSGNARVVLLDSQLCSVIMTVHKDWFDRPWRLCYVPESGRLLVGAYSGVVDTYCID